MNQMAINEEIKKLKEEFVSFKLEMIMRNEDQFLKIKSQIAQMMDEISLQSPIVKNVKMTPLQKNVNSSSYYEVNSEKNLMKSTNTHLLIDQAITAESGMGKKSALQNRNNYETTDLFPFSEKSKTKENKDYVNKIKDDAVNEYSVGNPRKTFFHHSCRPRVKSCCLTCKSKERLTKIDRRKTKQTFARVKRLEKIIKVCLSSSSSFVENIMSQPLLDISEKIDENSFDIDQCWSETKDIKDKNKFIMLNGDIVKVEDEINRMNFVLEALWSQTEEQALLISRLQQTISEKLNHEIKSGLLTLTWRQDIIIAFQNHKSQLQGEWREDIITSFQNILKKLLFIWRQDMKSACQDVLKKVGLDKPIKFPVYVAKEDILETDIVMHNDTTQNSTTRHKCITAMTEYQNWCIEELRHFDYKGLGTATSFYPSFQDIDASLLFSDMAFIFSKNNVNSTSNLNNKTTSLLPFNQKLFRGQSNINFQRSVKLRAAKKKIKEQGLK